MHYMFNGIRGKGQNAKEKRKIETEIKNEECIYIYSAASGQEE